MVPAAVAATDMVGQGPLPRDLSAQGTIRPDGTGQVILGVVPVGQRWEVYKVTVNCASALFSQAFVFKGVDDTQSNLLDQTQQFGGNSNTTDTPMLLHQGDTLRVTWKDATPGSVCGATASLRQLPV